MTRALVAAVLAAGLFSVAARAEETPARRRLAVLEYRAGVEQQKGVADRLAARLKKTSSLTVIDAAEARRRLGKVDSEVARCAGNPTCVAQLGARLDVDEILLVGVSQLGDVVIALQRIDVESAQVGAHLAETLSDGEALADDKLGAWLKQLYPPEVFKRFGFIVVTADRDGAVVALNGQSRGETPLEGKIKVLAPKAYRVTVEKDGYVPFSARIDVPADATVEVRAELPSVGVESAWYKRWYLWAAVGGVVAAAAIGSAVYAARPDDMHLTAILQR